MQWHQHVLLGSTQKVALRKSVASYQWHDKRVEPQQSWQTMDGRMESIPVDATSCTRFPLIFCHQTVPKNPLQMRLAPPLEAGCKTGKNRRNRVAFSFCWKCVTSISASAISVISFVTIPHYVFMNCDGISSDRLTSTRQIRSPSFSGGHRRGR